mmetsp:Transcript_2144/g.2450  ORF Transcript_2144/g.2450 Transcript_2144/m.2450 type:complete len:145 (+) Transcript_2144:847-1281(+)
MIASFSINPTYISYGFFEIGYFLVNGTITWIAIWMLARVFKHDRNHDFEALAYILIPYAVLLNYGYNQYNEGLKTMETPSSETPTSTPIPEVETRLTLGYWEYFGIVIMIGPRFIYSVYKLIRYCKTEQVVDKEEDLLSISDFD